MISLNDNDISAHVTRFPDGTCQVWNLPELFFQEQTNLIRWDYEGDHELMQVMQLADLIIAHCDRTRVNLFMPFLPYGRQDKGISNTATFGLHTFLSVLIDSNFFNKIVTIDAHSKIFSRYSTKYIQLTSIFPWKGISNAKKKFSPTAICYPDVGAMERYEEGFLEENSICFEKTRDQQTGNINGMVIYSGEEHIAGQRVLIVDDICDGGRTFIEAAKILEAKGASKIGLYVSHGIFSKGKEPLLEAGISEIYTKESK